MIKISVDEARAYDEWVILQLKIVTNEGTSPVDLYFAEERLLKEIKEQVGVERHNTIQKSREFLRLLGANSMVFDRIRTMKADGERPGDATYIDQHNYQRYLYKKALQEKFFPNSKLTEVKLGYESKKS